jgi:multiple sugar transport system substrate-binding protein
MTVHPLAARPLRSVASAALSALLVLGPASVTTSLASPSAAPADQPAPATIRLWFMPNGADPASALQTEIDAFNQLHPEITIQPEQVDWGSAFTRIQTGIQGGDAPCITQLGTTWVPGFSAMGGLRPFTADEVAAVGGQSNFVPASWATSGLSGTSDVTAMPWFADVRALAYRKDLLAKAGLTPSEAFKDWTSFESTLTKIKQSSPEVSPFVHPGKNDWNVWQNGAMWIWGAGGDLLSPDYSHAVFNSAASVHGITEFASLYGKGLTESDTLELNSAQVEQKFGDGKTFSLITGPWLISNARSAPDKGGWTNATVRQNLAFAEFPSGPGGQYTFVGGSNLAILNSCPSPAAAVAFVNYLVGNESQVRYAQTIGMLPVTQTAQADPNFTTDPLYAPFLSAAAKGKTSAPIAQWGQVEPTLQEQLQAIWDDVGASGKTTPITEDKVKARLDAAARAVDGYLK